ncbi:acyl-CoA dehydrogenase family protein [Sulfolobus acidocaldarius]|uniref:Acyl-CoA dehydrogenase n=4 Tax=Sulfolobus acidocaldarius TaxID=2285 RepID=Q4J9Z0_SULAC|nr:acyl-CoA dehydrogenase family protein [Sulfolobus acidocaldarius]AAY80390.1 acyl-CoA dehydrogenase [Sulfolobus acidocaldarius DSM 639]AGE70973.1 acyl-CoA dehydrogenase [Sulfolobus acidocaldarius N8]AGE73244.1 acyl-CoA dehydrogenase [Sulfolobus acidocaldarius Ron12/I]ALU28723.1 acyl-CoA dehydrogenase [Sulfolobus acidocaldarius]ALU31442.1 acyl-CoA dehydrogenase [Sulfolobus acidocaldarius]
MVFPLKSLEDLKLEISQDHEILRQTIREFAEKEVSGYVDKGESERDVPKVLKERAKELGLYGPDVPTELGGQGSDYLSLLVISEELSRVWTSFSTLLLVHWMLNRAIYKYGKEEVKKKYLPLTASGEKIGAFANTEPEAGTDVAGIRSTAKKVNDHYIINARKIFITNGDIADYFVLTARTSPPSNNARWKGITMFLVEKEWGVKTVSRIETTGLKASHTTEIILEDVKVPAENVIGEEGMGFKYAVESFDYARTIVSAQAVGIGQSAFEKLVNYSLQRKAFDKPIAEFQIVQQKVSESFADLLTSRFLTYWAGSLYNKGKTDEYIVAASLAKFYATEAAEKIVMRAMTAHGGYGVSNSIGLERMLRDLQILKTYEGTNDIQRVSAARQFFYRFMGIKI